MEVEDLMIGDWILIPMSNVPIKVTGVNDEGVTVYNEDDYTEYPYYISDIEPISLTPEILEKNGFKEDFETNGIYWRPDCRKFCIVKELDTWYFAFRMLGETVDKSSGYICISECKYVHKLQHKLKDLEIKKEIVL